MVLQMTSKKVAWTDCCTKSINAPHVGNAPSAAYTKYLQCNEEVKHLKFLQWLRVYDHDKPIPKAYKSGETLVAVKYLSIFNGEFFFQFLAMNFAHTDETVLHHQRETDLPEPIRYYVQAVDLLPELWCDTHTVREYLAAEAHKRYHVETIINYLQALDHVYTIWKIHLVSSSFASTQNQSPEARFPLSPQQTALYKKFNELLRSR